MSLWLRIIKMSFIIHKNILVRQTERECFDQKKYFLLIKRNFQEPSQRIFAESFIKALEYAWQLISFAHSLFRISIQYLNHIESIAKYVIELI